MTRQQQWAAIVGLVTAMEAAACGGGGSGGGGGGNITGPSTSVSLTSLSVSPTSISGCGTAQVTATLSGAAPAGGATVALTIAPPGPPAAPFASIAPSTLTIAAGATSGTATVTPTDVPTPPTFTITGGLQAGTGLTASTQSTTLTVTAPLPAFTVSGTARGADACQITNASGQFDCTFNGAASVSASRWTWAWRVGNTDAGPQETTTPTFQPTTGCGFFTSTAPTGPAGGTHVQMIVDLTVQNAGGTRSCRARNANVRVFSGGFCGGF